MPLTLAAWLAGSWVAFAGPMATAARDASRNVGAVEPQERSYRAVRTNETMTIDGRADEQTWREAPVDDRIREQVREELGEAYSPGAASQAGRVYPGVGFIAINSSAEPERAAEVLEVCLDVADTLGAEGVGAEELDRLREPVLKRVRDQMRQNGFWLGMLSQSQSDPGRLDEVRELLSDYEGMTVEDISGLAGEYLQRDRASWVIVRPEEPEPGT